MVTEFIPFPTQTGSCGSPDPAEETVTRRGSLDPVGSGTEGLPDWRPSVGTPVGRAFGRPCHNVCQGTRALIADLLLSCAGAG